MTQNKDIEQPLKITLVDKGQEQQKPITKPVKDKGSDNVNEKASNTSKD